MIYDIIIKTHSNERNAYAYSYINMPKNKIIKYLLMSPNELQYSFLGEIYSDQIVLKILPMYKYMLKKEYPTAGK